MAEELSPRGGSALASHSRMVAMPASPRVRSLVPKEHGAYAQLGLPLLTGLCMGKPGWFSLLLSVGFLAALLAHEPLLVAMGRRGPRARRDDGARARFRLMGLLALGSASLSAVLAFAPHTVRGALVIPATLGIVTGLVLLADAERSLLGEWVAAAALSSTIVPLSVAGGRSPAEALQAFVVFVLGFFASVSAVRASIATKKHGVGIASRLMPVLATGAVGLILAGLRVVPLWVPIAAAPMVAGAVVLAAFPPPPRALMRVGWMLVATSVATAALVVIHARSP